MTVATLPQQNVPTLLTTSGAVGGRAPRIAAIDIVRGLAMILMAIDHVRDFAGVPAGGATPALFFTRWITHFAAPTFCFLAGTSIFIMRQRMTRTQLCRFLITRGLWLVVLELTFLRVAWSFDFAITRYSTAGVIWMLGWCIVAMAGLIWLPFPAIAAVGVVIVAGQNVVDLFSPGIITSMSRSEFSWLWRMLYFGGRISVGASGASFFVLYPILPWIGVMCCGYAFGAVLRKSPAQRRRICLLLGLICIALFIGLRAWDVYGDPRPWRAIHQARRVLLPVWSVVAPAAAPAVLHFLDTVKYPPSLLYLLMMLGPMFVVLAVADFIPPLIAGVVATFGRVPFFYYLLHLPLIHAVALLVSNVRAGNMSSWLFGNHPISPPGMPPGYPWPLWMVYAVWFSVVVALYWPCRWYARLKQRNRSVWLSYL